MTSAFVTGGSGFIGGALIERLRREGWTVRALARSDSAAARVAELGAEPVRGDLEDRVALERGRGRLRGRLPLRRQGRRLGRARGIRAPQRVRHPERARRLHRRRGQALRARRHGGRPLRGPGARERGRGRPAAARLADPLRGLQGGRRAARARRQRRRHRDGRHQAPLRVGPRRHHPAAGAREARRVGTLSLDRRRRASHRHDERGQHGRGAVARQPRRRPPAASTS